MNRDEIGANAGLVWSALNGNGEIALKAIKKATKLKDKELFLALGWLMREDKIAIVEVEGDCAASLL